MRTDSLWLRTRDRASLVLLLRCAADLLASGRAVLGASTTDAASFLGLPMGHQIVAYKLMKHASALWKNLDLSERRNVPYLGIARVTDVHVWAALFAAARVEEGDWP